MIAELENAMRNGWTAMRTAGELAARYDVPLGAWLNAPSACCFAARVRLGADNFFSFDSESRIMAIALVTDIANGETGYEFADLLAFRPRIPGRWWLFRGQAAWLNGWELAAREQPYPSLPYAAPALAAHAQETSTPIHIWRNPLSWLRAGCRGSVALCKSALGDLRGLSTQVVAEDLAHANEIDAYLRAPFKHPEILVPAPEGRAA